MAQHHDLSLSPRDLIEIPPEDTFVTLNPKAMALSNTLRLQKCFGREDSKGWGEHQQLQPPFSCSEVTLLDIVSFPPLHEASKLAFRTRLYYEINGSEEDLS